MMTARLGLSPAWTGLAFAFAAACGGQVDGSPRLSQLEARTDDVTTLEFTRVLATQGASAPLHATITDPGSAQALYRETLALPEQPGTSPCKTGIIRYHLTFLGSRGVVLEADEEPDGCERVTLGGVTAPLAAGDAYWAKLSKGLGVPESIMYPETLETK